MQVLDYDFASTVVVAALNTSVDAAAKEFEITPKTVRKYKRLLAQDEHMVQWVQEKSKRLNTKLHALVTAMNISVIEAVKRTADSEGVKDSETLEALVKSCVSINESQLKRKAFDVQLEQLKQLRQGSAQVVDAGSTARLPAATTTSPSRET